RAGQNMARALAQQRSRDGKIRNRRAARRGVAGVGEEGHPAMGHVGGSRLASAGGAAPRRWRTGDRLDVRKRMAAEFQFRPARWRASMNAPFTTPIRTAPHNIE